MISLATIERVNNVSCHLKADRLEIVFILNVPTVIRKGQFKTGDLGVFCKVESVMPPKPEFEFLKVNGYRIRKTMICGAWSYGILFPLSILPETYKVNLGDDVTDILGVTLYKPSFLEVFNDAAVGFNRLIPKPNLISPSLKEQEKNKQLVLQEFKEYGDSLLLVNKTESPNWLIVNQFNHGENHE